VKSVGELKTRLTGADELGGALAAKRIVEVLQQENAAFAKLGAVPDKDETPNDLADYLTGTRWKVTMGNIKGYLLFTENSQVRREGNLGKFLYQYDYSVEGRNEIQFRISAGNIRTLSFDDSFKTLTQDQPNLEAHLVGSDH
jgi:hypothetical protein